MSFQQDLCRYLDNWGFPCPVAGQSSGNAIAFILLENTMRWCVLDIEDYGHISSFKWHTDQDGYAVRSTKSSERPRFQKTLLKMHRIIMATPVGLVVDHINGNPLDNRKANMRNCTKKENSRNRRKPFHAQGRFKGVYRVPNGWRTSIRLNSGVIYNKQFSSELEAAHEYDRLAQKEYGKFARLNFPEVDFWGS